MRVSITARLFFYYLISTVLAVDQDANSDLVSRLRSANTLLDRLNLLSSDTDWVYDHNTNPKWSFTPGSVTNANGATFPAMTGTGMTIAMLNLGPCAMLPPHLHRATNIVVSVSGKTDTYMIQENGARIIKTTLTAGKQTVFPIASLHTMVNNECEPAQLVSALNSEDPATLNIFNNGFALDASILNRLFQNKIDVNETLSTLPAIGTGSNSGTDECLARCNAKAKAKDKAKRSAAPDADVGAHVAETAGDDDEGGISGKGGRDYMWRPGQVQGTGSYDLREPPQATGTGQARRGRSVRRGGGDGDALAGEGLSVGDEREYE